MTHPSKSEQSTTAEEAGLTLLAFEDMVRDVLHHLYDQVYVFRHPLISLVDAPAESTPSQRAKRLLQAILDAIESSRPPAGTPGDSRSWRHYHLLEQRYIGGMSAGEVMTRLDISKSQYQRDHAGALQSLALLLWNRWRLDQRQPRLALDPNSRESLALDEADDLVVQMNPDYIDLGDLLRDLVALLQPIATENHTLLELRASCELFPAFADRVALRLVFLGVLNYALGRCAGGALRMSLDVHAAFIKIVVSATTLNEPLMAQVKGGDVAELDVSRRLLAAMDGDIAIESQGRGSVWRACISLPCADRPTVMVVDNHPDFVGLVTRYLAEDKWQILSAQDVRQAQRLAAEHRLSAILLDVMMPGQDGWDLLLALKGKPETRQIPVIVCSVLYEPQVARALGAVRYLPKPISQAELLGALAPYARRTRAPESVD